MADPFERILIIRLSALGDVIHVLPALEALRRVFPAASFSWVTEELSAPLLKGHPYLEKVWVLPRKTWQNRIHSSKGLLKVAKEAASFFRDLRKEGYDLALDFQGNLRGAVVARLSAAPVTMGFHKKNTLEGSHLLHRRHCPYSPPLVHRVERNLQIPRAFGFNGTDPGPVLPSFAEEREKARSFLSSLQRPVILCHPGVSPFGAFKAWTEEGFAAFASMAVRKFGANVVFSWSPREKEEAERIAGKAGKGAFLAPPCPSVADMAGLIAEVDLLVAPDTGILHLADALGTPVVALFGPKDPRIYGPRYAQRKVVRSNVPCSPCEKRSCKERTCMLRITPEMVLEGVGELLGKKGHGGS